MKTRTELLAALRATDVHKNTVAYRRVRLAITGDKEGIFDGVQTIDGKVRIKTVSTLGWGQFTSNADHEGGIKYILTKLEIPFESGNFSTSGKGTYGKCVFIPVITD